MTPERWQQIQAVFESASTRSPAERRALLDQACGDDTELRTEVESLLGAEDLDVTLLDGKVLEIGGQMLARGQSVAGTRLGNYRILREIGRGGMAAVYASVRADEQYHQQVAIKLIRHGMDSERMVARFRQERQILANLVHPNIARLLDGGVTSDGLPYLVMERIDGEPIDTYCDRRSLSIADRLQLFRTVCSAVHYAHQNLVIHRDLKPSNILVTEEGSPKLLDFGIAKLIEPDSTETTGELTLDGPRPMTPEYASPEQVLDRPVTTASDVYALGVLLYRLLTGQRPYRIEQLTQREIERVICDQEPERPSATFRVAEPGDSSNGTPTRDAISRRRDATAEQLRRRLRGDLDNIVRMAMRKTPERRYGSAQQLSEDIRRHLERLPVIARDDSLGYLTAKFIRRNRLAVSAAGLIFLSLTGGLAVALWQAAVARTERLTAQTVASFVIEDVFKVSDPEKARGEDITARQLLERSAAKIDHLADQPIVQAALMDAIGSVYLGLGLLDEAAPHLERALDLRRQHLSANDPALADSLAHVGEYLADRGRIAEAEALHSEALDLRRRQLDADDPRLAQSEADLALMVAMRGRLDEAEVLMRQALERQQEVLGEDHEKVAETLNSLALVLRRKGQLEEAAPIYRRALDTTIERLGDDHPQVLVNLNNLAIVLCNLGQHSAATSLFERAEALGTKVLGENHSSLATTRSNLASCLQSRGDIEAAEALFRDALDLRRTTLGPNHPRVAASLNNLGNLLYQRGDIAGAEPLFSDALRIYRLQPESLHPGAASALNNLAATLRRRGELRGAEDLLREALTMNRAMLGEAHPEIALNLSNLGAVLERRGEVAAAEEHYLKALAIYQQLFGGVHLQAAVTRHALALLLRQAGRLDEAEAEARAAVTLRRELLGDAHRELALSTLLLGRLLLEQGDPSAAEPILRQAVDVWLRLPETARQPGLAITHGPLGHCLSLLGNNTEAEALLSESEAYLRNRFGAGHRWTREARAWLDALR